MKTSFFILSTALLFADASRLYGQNKSEKELENLVTELLGSKVDGDRPGTALMVTKNGEVLINRSYGKANLEHDIAISDSSRFDIASLSKQFAGYAISKMVEEGRISLDEDIRKYIPELNDFGKLITIDHLIHHTSGIRDWTSTLPLSGRTFEDVISFDHILRMAFQQDKLNFDPGEQYVYSNTGYNLLAELVQRVSGTGFREWTDENIFHPLGMNESFFLDDHKEIIPNRVTGYSRSREGAFTASPNLLTALGSSSMHSTVTDLTKWTSHLIDGINSGDPVILRMLSKGILNNGEENSYAFGLNVHEFRGTQWINHSGSWASFATYLVVIPEHDISFVILSNFPRGNSAGIAREIFGHIVPDYPTDSFDESTNESASENFVLDPTVLDHYTGTYRLGPTWYVDISKQDDSLWSQATNERRVPMTAISKDHFQVAAYRNRTMTFQRDTLGDVSSLIYQNEERPKMKDSFAYDSVDNDQYIGQYFSEELNTYFEIMETGDELELWHFDHGEISLKPVWNDDFDGGVWWINSVVFHRNEDGAISGFSTSNFRARDQWFKKK